MIIRAFAERIAYMLQFPERFGAAQNFWTPLSNHLASSRRLICKGIDS